MVTTLSSKALKETLGPLAKQMRDITELASTEKRKLTTEEDAKFEELHNEYEQVKGHADQIARVEAIESDLQAKPNAQTGDPGRTQTPGREDTVLTRPDDGIPTITEQTRSDAFRGWALYSAGKEHQITTRQEEAAKLLKVRFNSPTWEPKLVSEYDQVRMDFARRQMSFRALGKDTDTAGGFTVASGFIPSLENALLQFGGMRQVATVLRTDTGAALAWPTSDDTSNEGAVVGENQAVTEQDITYGQVVFYSWEYTSKLVRVSTSLLTDSAFNLASEIGMRLGERIARRQNRDFTTGDGASKATGITVDATTGVTAAAATVFTVDELYDLKHSVDPAYRFAPTWMFNDTTLLAIKKKKDGEGRYLWQSSLAGGVPDTVDGDPIQINQHMPSATSALKPIVYGDLKKYHIRDVTTIITRRLVERYAEYNQEGFVGFVRSDGKLVDAGTNPVKVMLMA